jgi:hypothetical protein
MPIHLQESSDEELIVLAMRLLCGSVRNLQDYGDKYRKVDEGIAIYYEYDHMLVRKWTAKNSGIAKWEVDFTAKGAVVSRNVKIN